MISVSSAVTGESGERQAYDESFQYMAAYIGNDTVSQAVSEELVNQILSTFIGEIPGSDTVSFIQSIVSAGIDAAKNPTQACQEISDVGILADQFQMTYVSSNINGDANLYAYSLYPGETTMNWVKAFNEYMQNGTGAEYAQGCGYNDLPNGELTIAYLMTYPNEVCGMLADLDFKLVDNSETSGYKEEIINIYQQIKNE